mmetsp:Transcript_26829/g.29913  ORF Transcript_26829/g.29913 Transcript_26829/m.29913 type:complete len:791 (+) Transcript_26829:113-2485(+)|eukprot:CAMPEP_0168528270 /NCGR_PEP_ID=MMETSP0405-20121227/13147_1 /TAXON_ID=498012 /ORGANISM="Trichosphaerium sp, Strain Am-I-7 wt" /LENGTH=790 /DNA_ID=CAMNT_0008551639 /DNA_START=56 /DNA_END=2428 /DNA_ORIENTATION=-
MFTNSNPDFTLNEPGNEFYNDGFGLDFTTTPTNDPGMFNFSQQENWPASANSANSLGQTSGLFNSSGNLQAPDLGGNFTINVTGNGHHSPGATQAMGEPVSSPYSDTPTSPDSIEIENTPPHSPPQNSSNIFVATVLHKPRGKGGKYVTIEEGQRIRVTRDRGKRLRVVLETVVTCDWSNAFQLLLDDVNEDGTVIQTYDANGPGFDIEANRMRQSTPLGNEPPRYTIELEIKVYLIHRRLRFRVCASSTSGQLHEGRTVEFYTHDSGRRGDPKKASTKTRNKTSSNTPAKAPSRKRRRTTSGPDTQSSVGPSSFLMTPMSQQQAQPIVPQMPLQQRQIPPQQQPMAFTQGMARQQMPQHINGDLQVNGYVKAHGFFQYSDERLKTDITDIVDAMQVVTNLNGKTYKWKPGTEQADARGGERVIGFIAQEVQKIAPSVIKQAPDGFLTVNYIELLPYLVEAFKQLVADHEKSKGEIDGDISALKADVAALLSKKSETDDLKEQLILLRRRVSRLSYHAHGSDAASASTSAGDILTMSGKRRLVKAESDSSSTPPHKKSSSKKKKKNSKLAYISIALLAAMIVTAGLIIVLLVLTVFADNDGGIDDDIIWTANQVDNPSFEATDITDPSIALLWEFTEGVSVVDLENTPGIPIRHGTNVIKLESVNGTQPSAQQLVVPYSTTNSGSYNSVMLAGYAYTKEIVAYEDFNSYGIILTMVYQYTGDGSNSTDAEYTMEIGLPFPVSDDSEWTYSELVQPLEKDDYELRALTVELHVTSATGAIYFDDINLNLQQ